MNPTVKTAVPKLLFSSISAEVLQRLVTTDGIHGRVRIEFDENYKFVRLEPVGDV